MNEPTLNFDDIKFELLILSPNVEIPDFCTFLLGIIRHNQEVVAYMNTITLLQSRFSNGHNDYRHNRLSYDNWSVNRTRMSDSVTALIESLEASYLIDNYEQKLADFRLKIVGIAQNKPTDTPLNADSFEFPEFTNEVKVPETAELTDAERMEYRRLIIKCQNAIAVQNYAEAFKFCDTASKEIEPESAQLHEYLLLTFIKKETAEKIIKEALRGERAKFEHVLLFAVRSKKYQRDKKPKCPSPTLEGNLKKIADNLAQCLLREYRQIKSNWLFYTEGGDDKIFLKDKLMVQRSMEIFEDIFTKISPSKIFLSEIYYEICGAGKFQWIKLDVNDKPYSAVQNYNALSKKSPIEDRLRTDFLQDFKRTEKAPDNPFAVKVYYALWSKYMELRAKIKERLFKKGDILKDESEARQQMVRCFDAFKTAYRLFGDKRFLDIPLKELSENGVVSWFKLDRTTTHLTNISENTSFDALKELEFYRNESGHSAETIDNIEQRAARELVEETNKIYDQIGLKYSSYPSVLERERPQIYDCLRQWFTAYRVLRDANLIQKIILELTGYRLLFWFRTTQNTFEPMLWQYENEVISTNHFVKEMLSLNADNKIEGFSWQHIKSLVAKRFFEWVKSLCDKEYENTKYTHKAIPYLEILSNCHIWNPHLPVLDYVVEHIWAEKLYNWLYLRDGGVLETTQEGKQNGFDATAQIQAFSQKVSSDSLVQSIQKKLSEKFFADAELAYNRINDGSENPISRQKIVYFIKACRNCFLLSPRAEYLNSAINELSGYSKLKWINSLSILGRFNVSKGQVNGFDAIRTLTDLNNLVSSVTS